MEKGGGGLLKSSREQHFTVVLLANVHPNAYFSCCPILKLLPCTIKTVQRFLLDCMSAIANQKFNQLYLQGYQPLQNHWEDCCEGLTRTPEGSEGLALYNAPCQQETTTC
jgi:hypothetical protein